MFGSITTSTNVSSLESRIDNRPPKTSTNTLDPWDDTSLIQMWQQSICSYKNHHTEPDISKAIVADPLVERMKRVNSTIPEGQMTSKKRAKVEQSNAKVTLESTSTQFPTIEKTTTYKMDTTYKETDNVNDDNDDDDDQAIVDENNIDNTNQVYEEEYNYQTYNEEEEKDQQAEETAENQEYQDYYNGSYDYNYEYSHYNQPHSVPPVPPTMPFAPPPVGQQGNGNEALTNMIMAWYYSGYYTGLYQAQQQR